MYASTYHSPPKVDYPYQEQQQLSGSSQPSPKEPVKTFSETENENLRKALEGKAV